MKNKILLLLIILVLSPFSAATITDYRVLNPVPLGSNITVSGQLDSNANGLECIFTINDSNGDFVKRLTGEFTEYGFFSTDYFIVTDPPFSIDRNYTFTTKCGNDSNVATFSVAQPIPIVGQTANVIIWIKDNFLAAMIALSGIVAIFGLFYWMIRGRL